MDLPKLNKNSSNSLPVKNDVAIENIIRVQPDVFESVLDLLDQNSEANPELQRLLRSTPVWKR